MSQVLITFAYSSFFFFSKYLPCHIWRLFYLFYAKQCSVNPFMYYAQKLANIFLKFCGITPQDLQSMFGHFSIFYMKDLTCFLIKRNKLNHMVNFFMEKSTVLCHFQQDVQQLSSCKFKVISRTLKKSEVYTIFILLHSTAPT